MSDVTVSTRAHEFVCADHIAPNPGSSVMPNVIEQGFGKYALNTIVWNALWSAHFEIESGRIKELMSKMELEPKDHSHEIGFGQLQPCPREQWFAMLACSITKAEDVYPIIDKTFSKMVESEKRKEIENAKMLEQERAFHSQLLKDAGVNDLVDAAKSRLKNFPDIFERRSVAETKEQIKAMVGIGERGSFDWIKVPIWAQARVTLAVISGMAFESAILSNMAPAKLKYMSLFQKDKLDEITGLASKLGELRHTFKLAFQNANVKAEIDAAIEAGRIKEHEIETLMRVLA